MVFIDKMNKSTYFINGHLDMDLAGEPSTIGKKL